MLSKITNAGRILGASAIFYYHVGLVIAHPFSEWGEYAVMTFILMSGIAYTCFSSVHPHDLPSFIRYAAGRVQAIFPMFIALNVLIFLASFLYPSALGRPFSFLELFLSSTGLSQYFGFRYLSKVMWFIPFILQAYLLFPLITCLLDRLSAAWIILAAFVVSLAAVGLTFFSLPPGFSAVICREWSVLFRLPEVCLGVVIGATIFQRRDLRGGLVALGLFAGVSLVLATAVSARFEQAAYILSLPWHGLVVSLGIAALAAAVAPAITQKRMVDWSRLLGTASFPFFLVHGIALLFIYHHAGNSQVVWLGYFVFCWVEAVLFTLALRFASRSLRPGRRPLGAAPTFRQT